MFLKLPWIPMRLWRELPFKPLGDWSTGDVGTEFTVWAPFSCLYSGKILSELLSLPSKDRSSYLCNHHMYLTRKKQFLDHYATIHHPTHLTPKRYPKKDMTDGEMFELFCHSHLEGHHQNSRGVLPVCQLKDKSGTKALTTSVWWPGSHNKKMV